MIVKDKQFSPSTDPRIRAGEEAEVVANCDHLTRLEMKIEPGPFSQWRAMRGMRNRMAHGYFDINLQVVWDTVQLSLPELEEKLADLLKNAPPDPQ